MIIHETDGSQRSVDGDVPLSDAQRGEFTRLYNAALEANMAGSEPEVVSLDLRPGVRQECWFSCGTSSGRPFTRVVLGECTPEDRAYFRGEFLSPRYRAVKPGSLEEMLAVLGFAGNTRPISTGLVCGAAAILITIIVMMVVSAVIGS